MRHRLRALTATLLAIGLLSPAHAIEAKDCAPRGERSVDLWTSMSLAEEAISDIARLVDETAKGKHHVTVESASLAKSAEYAALAVKTIRQAKESLAKFDVPSLAERERIKAMLLIIRMTSLAQIGATRAAWSLVNPMGDVAGELVDETGSSLIIELSTHADCLLIGK